MAYRLNNNGTIRLNLIFNIVDQVKKFDSEEIIDSFGEDIVKKFEQLEKDYSECNDDLIFYFYTYAYFT